MSIEIYDRATVIEKDDTKYYLLKNGSRNSFIIGGQTRTGNDFKPEFVRRQARDSNWHVIAKGEGRMADTKFNCPTSYIYGRIMFGNRKNIALFLDKQKVKKFEDFDEVQQAQINSILRYALKDSEHCIDLQNIKQEQKRKDTHDYCDKKYDLFTDGDGIIYKEKAYWNLDNL